MKDSKWAYERREEKTFPSVLTRKLQWNKIESIQSSPHFQYLNDFRTVNYIINVNESKSLSHYFFFFRISQAIEISNYLFFSGNALS